MYTKPKIIYITCSMPYGSSEEFFIPEVKEMLRQGIEVLIVPRSPQCSLVNLDAEELLIISLPKPLLSVKILISAFCDVLTSLHKWMLILRMLSQDTNILVLLKNLAVLPKSIWLAKLAKKYNCTHIHAQWGLTTATMAMVASKLSGIPWSFTAHRGDIAGNNLLKLKIQSASFVRFISKSGLEMARGICDDELTGQTHIIHMGVTIPLGIGTSISRTVNPVILCPASFLPVKGHKYLLEAIAILQSRGVQCAFQFAGQGILQKGLEKHARDLNITRHVTFLGQVPHNQLLELYQKGKVSVVVLPSIDIGNNEHEGIPVSLMEAMSHGVPCISTTTGGIPELLENEAGILVPPLNSHALADAIEKLLQNDQFYIRMAKNGYLRVIEEFNIEKSIEKLIFLLETTGYVHR